MNDIFKIMATVLLTVVISMTGFWMMIGREYTTRSEVDLMIVNNSPYNEDRKLIFEKLETVTQIAKDSVQADKELTRVLNELRIEISALRQMIANLEDRSE